MPNLYGIVCRRALTPDDPGDLPVVQIDENLVSGNLADGILGRAARIAGNRIGTDVDGLRPVPNGGNGVADAGEVGGARPDGSTTCEYPCNVISGNAHAAVSGATSVTGNFIGTDLSGRVAIPNGTADDGGAAVFTSGTVGGVSGAVLDGVCDAACNVISGNRAAGVRATVVQGNVIGATIDLQPLPNASGVLVDVEPVQIGGDGLTGNRITFNRERAVFGVAVPSLAPTRFELIGNIITGNGDGFVGITSDGNPAGQEMFGGPYYLTVIDSARRSGRGIIIEGRVAVPAIRTSDLQIELYGAQRCELGNQPEKPLARRILGISEGASFQSTVLADGPYDFVMAIATYGGFSRWPTQCIEVSGSSCASGATADSVGCRLRDLDAAISGLGTTKTGKKLRNRLAAAIAAVDRAQALLEQGKTGPAKKALRKASMALAAVERLLGSKKLANALPEEVRGRVRDDLAAVRTDLGTLKRTPTP